MKIFKILPLLFILILLSGCSANLVGKLDDYNEIVTGNIKTNLLSAAIVDVKFEKQGTACTGISRVYYYPVSSIVAQIFFIPRCTGQKGYVILDCSDKTSFRTQFEVTGPFCGQYEGKGFDAHGRNFTYYINLKDNKVEKILEQYRKDVENKPAVPGSSL
jgi:hypothetical protein